ncbi:hypothetical protein J6590_010993 [Homalodisca vitripennis]|nr:hypothetical protein J6590_010993 [Homalodisca vitripennis]
MYPDQCTPEYTVSVYCEMLSLYSPQFRICIADVCSRRSPAIVPCFGPFLSPNCQRVSPAMPLCLNLLMFYKHSPRVSSPAKYFFAVAALSPDPYPRYVAAAAAVFGPLEPGNHLLSCRGALLCTGSPSLIAERRLVVLVCARSNMSLAKFVGGYLNLPTSMTLNPIICVRDKTTGLVAQLESDASYRELS